GGRLIQADGEHGVGGAAVALGYGHVVDRQGQRRVVVEDGADGLAAHHRHVGTGNVDVEGLVGLDDRLAGDGDTDRLADVAGVEVEPAAGAVVVTAGGCRPVGGRVIDEHRAGGRRGQADREAQGLGAAVALQHRGVGDGDGRRGVVVDDGGGAGGVG